jgi:toxin-antitoxin system PIN domain toxin
MTSSVFPDVNVWLALAYPGHVHHGAAAEWFHSLRGDELFIFCRHTQMGLFRILTTEAAMGPDVRTQRQCWELYERWTSAGKAVLLPDPDGLEEAFEARTSADSPLPKTWADAYLAAFAECGNCTLVTFDRALAARAQGSILLA